MDTLYHLPRALSRLLEAAPELGVTDTHERVNPEIDRKKRVISRYEFLFSLRSLSLRTFLDVNVSLDGLELGFSDSS